MVYAAVSDLSRKPDDGRAAFGPSLDPNLRRNDDGVGGTAMIGTHRARVRYLGAVVASVIALNLYTPLSTASASVATPASTCVCTIALHPVAGSRGTVVNIAGSHFTPNTKVTLQFVDAALVRTTFASATTGRGGNFRATVTIPMSAALGHGFMVANDGTHRTREGFLVTRVCSTVAAISLSPKAGKRNSSVDVSGTGFCPNTRVRVRFRDSQMTWTTLAMGVVTNDAGTFTVTGTIPNNAALGDGYIAVNDPASHQDAKKVFTVKP